MCVCLCLCLCVFSSPDSPVYQSSPYSNPLYNTDLIWELETDQSTALFSWQWRREIKSLCLCLGRWLWLCLWLWSGFVDHVCDLFQCPTNCPSGPKGPQGLQGVKVSELQIPHSRGAKIIANQKIKPQISCARRGFLFESFRASGIGHYLNVIGSLAPCRCQMFG